MIVEWYCGTTIASWKTIFCMNCKYLVLQIQNVSFGNFFLHYLYQNLWPNVQQNWSNKNLWVHCSFVQIPIWWNWSYRCIILGLCMKLGKEFLKIYKNFCIFLVLEVQKNRSYQTSRIIGTNNVYKNTLYKYYVPPYHRRFDQKGGTI